LGPAAGGGGASFVSAATPVAAMTGDKLIGTGVTKLPFASTVEDTFTGWGKTNLPLADTSPERLSGCGSTNLPLASIVGEKLIGDGIGIDGGAVDWLPGETSYKVLAPASATPARIPLRNFTPPPWRRIRKIPAGSLA